VVLQKNSNSHKPQEEEKYRLPRRNEVSDDNLKVESFDSPQYILNEKGELAEKFPSRNPFGPKTNTGGYTPQRIPFGDMDPYT